MNKYPYWKVIGGFTLCPAVIGVLLGVVFFFEAIATHKSTDPNPLLLGFAVTLLMAVVAVLFNIIASLPLALLYAVLKLRKGWGSYAFVAVAGGMGAFLAMRIIGRDGTEYLQAVADAWMTRRFWGAFLMGATASLIVAVVVLPERNA